MVRSLFAPHGTIIRISRLCFFTLYLAVSLSLLRLKATGASAEEETLPLLACRWRSERRSRWLAFLSAVGQRCRQSGCRAGDGPVPSLRQRVCSLSKFINCKVERNIPQIIQNKKGRGEKKGKIFWEIHEVDEEDARSASSSSTVMGGSV